VIATVMAAVVLHEPVGRRRMAGSVLVVIGVALLALT
jgi:drug/metabolite transporter (DMT)-like permease